MDHNGPHFDASLIGPKGQLMRLHKGAQASAPPPITPPKRGEAALTVEQAKARDPQRRQRGTSSTILSTGFSTSDNNSILGG